MRTRSITLATATLALGAASLVACGDDEDAATAEPGAMEAADDAPVADAPEAGEDAVDAGGSRGGGSGSGVVTMGDEAIEFDVVFCGFSPAETGNDDVLFSLHGQGAGGVTVDAGRQVGMTRTGQRDPDEDPIDNVSVWAGSFTDPDIAWGSFGLEPFLEIDGKDVRADLELVDEASGDFDPVPGTFEATCP